MSEEQKQVPDNSSQQPADAVPGPLHQNIPAGQSGQQGDFENMNNTEGTNPSIVNQAALLAGLQPSLKQMEVHHQHAPHKKRLLDYLFEFFMLFLAITLGFFVENKREHLNEGKREKQYIRSLAEDLRTDTAKVNIIMGYNSSVMAGLDSLISSIYRYKKNDTAIVSKIYQWYIYYARNNYTVNFTDRTMSQLKNTGNLRLIESQAVSDSITGYDEGVKRCNAQADVNREKCEKALDYSTTIFDYQYIRYNPMSPVSSPYPNQHYSLLSDDPVVLRRYANLLELWKQVVAVYMADTQGQKIKAMVLLDFLKKEYDLNG
jgi:hypothetical protein